MTQDPSAESLPWPRYAGPGQVTTELGTAP
jgi:hypothetical protein